MIQSNFDGAASAETEGCFHDQFGEERIEELGKQFAFGFIGVRREHAAFFPRAPNVRERPTEHARLSRLRLGKRLSRIGLDV